MVFKGNLCEWFAGSWGISKGPLVRGQPSLHRCTSSPGWASVSWPGLGCHVGGVPHLFALFHLPHFLQRHSDPPLLSLHSLKFNSVNIMSFTLKLKVPDWFFLFIGRWNWAHIFHFLRKSMTLALLLFLENYQSRYWHYTHLFQMAPEMGL